MFFANRSNTVILGQILKSCDVPPCVPTGLVQDPAGHVFFANRSACYIELGGSAWEPAKKTDLYAKALTDARACTGIAPDWAKVRQQLRRPPFVLVFFLDVFIPEPKRL